MPVPLKSHSLTSRHYLPGIASQVAPQIQVLLHKIQVLLHKIQVFLHKIQVLLHKIQVLRFSSVLVLQSIYEAYILHNRIIMQALRWVGEISYKCKSKLHRAFTNSQTYLLMCVYWGGGVIPLRQSGLFAYLFCSDQRI